MMARVWYTGWFKNCALVGNANHKIQVLNELYTYHSSMFFRHLWLLSSGNICTANSFIVHKSKYSESIQYAICVSKLMPSYFSDQYYLRIDKNARRYMGYQKSE